MTHIDDLIQQFVDGPDQLDENELDMLVEALREEPSLADDLKDQLLINELLAERLAVDRRDFMAQVVQRIRDQEAGMTGGSGEEEEVVREMLKLADDEIVEHHRQRRRARAWRLAGAAMLAVALAVGGYFGWQYVALGQSIGRVVAIDGQPMLQRGKTNHVLRAGHQILPGDHVVTLPDESVTVRYHDGTKLRLLADTSADFVRGGSEKKVSLGWGGLHGDISPQPVGRPLVFTTPLASVRVLGTQLWLWCDPQRTRIDVLSGLVELVRQEDRRKVTVRGNEYAVATPSELKVGALTWPVDRRGLVFLFATGDSPNLVANLETGEAKTIPAGPLGQARMDHNFAMVLEGGAFRAAAAEQPLLSACRATGTLSVEAVLRPASLEQTGPARIITFSTNSNDYNFMLGQERDRLVFRLLTTKGAGREGREVDVGSLTADAYQHVVVSYEPGRLECFINGRRVYRDESLTGRFNNWDQHQLLLGDEQGGGRDWAGTLEGVAIYNRFIGEEEAQRNAQMYHGKISRRSDVPQVEVVATLLAKSAVPTPQEIRPADAALVMCRYGVQRVVRGTLEEDEILVAQWAVLGGQAQPIGEVEPGTQRKMVLERFGLNPQLAEYHCSDDFRAGDNPPKARYYDITRP